MTGTHLGNTHKSKVALLFLEIQQQAVEDACDAWRHGIHRMPLCRELQLTRSAGLFFTTSGVVFTIDSLLLDFKKEEAHFGFRVPRWLLAMSAGRPAALHIDARVSTLEQRQSARQGMWPSCCCCIHRRRQLLLSLEHRPARNRLGCGIPYDASTGRTSVTASVETDLITPLTSRSCNPFAGLSLTCGITTVTDGQKGRCAMKDHVCDRHWPPVPTYVKLAERLLLSLPLDSMRRRMANKALIKKQDEDATNVLSSIGIKDPVAVE